MVSPTPRPAVPTIPPAVLVMPPTALPSYVILLADVVGCVIVHEAYHRGAGLGEALGALVVVGVERHCGCVMDLMWCVLSLCCENLVCHVNGIPLRFRSRATYLIYLSSHNRLQAAAARISDAITSYVMLISGA